MPASSGAPTSLPTTDYVDRFSMPSDLRATPEQWARAMFGDVPNPLQLILWRGLLGLRQGRERSPGLVAGWRVGGSGSGDDWIRPEACSPLFDANLVEASPGQVALTTCVHDRVRLGRAVLRPLSGVHRRLAPGLLPRAASMLRTGALA